MESVGSKLQGKHLVHMQNIMSTFTIALSK